MPSTGMIFAFNLLLLASMLATNMLALYNLSVSGGILSGISLRNRQSLDEEELLKELHSIQSELANTQNYLVEIQRQMGVLGNPFSEEMALQSITNPELRLYTQVRRLPLGRSPSSGEETMVSPIGFECYKYMELLDLYMNYTANGPCPDDWDLAQKLMIRGCEPLPRRRCFSRTPRASNSRPQSPWTVPPNDSIRWTHYTCKSFECLNKRKAFADCVNCFDMGKGGAEMNRWMVSRDKLDITIEEVLGLKNGSIRIGLDIGGGSGSFAVRMRERNVTIVTTTLNLDGPFNEFVALRGVLPLYITIGQRFPFSDNTLDIVHSMHILSHWIPVETLEFVVIDIDRVLRCGGLFWLDHFFCRRDQLQSVYVPLINRLGYRRIKWVTGNKTDSNGLRNDEVYLTALLEKPLRPKFNLLFDDSAHQ